MMKKTHSWNETFYEEDTYSQRNTQKHVLKKSHNPVKFHT